MSKTLCKVALLLLGLGAAAGSHAEAAVDADVLVKAADSIRFPQEAFQVDVRVKTEGGSSSTDERAYRILSKGNSQTIVLTIEPAAERGQILLMKDNDLWVFLPKVSQPVRLPLSQKLTGQVANGDLARANFSGDYTAKWLKTETIDGLEMQQLELTAARRGVTYQRVLYWVEAASKRPYKAEFYTVSGKLLKTCLYQDFKDIEGGTRPTRLVLTDALKADERSVMVYSNMKRRQLEDKIFTKEYMKKLQ
jgi:outer membrane lipoprotein-sorting protein